ncbi:MAG: hypothetical protein C0614_02395, partial [Desulfuromonas sp.]
DSDGHSPVPIGRPIANVATYLLDRQLMPVPDGVPGQLCLGGIALADGYLNRPEQTAKAFIDHPLAASGRLYLTGDLARRLSDGSLQFLGRLDDQVKIRGFRVELEEVRQTLASHPAVRDLAVAPLGDNGIWSGLLACYVSDVTALQPTELRGWLSSRLPHYMVPDRLLAVTEIPLNRHGKVDLAALPLDQAEQGEAPNSQTEQQVAALFNEILQITEPTRTTNFFDVGGQSLRAMQLTGRLYQRFGVQLPLNGVYNNPTVAGLAEIIDQQTASEYSPIPCQPQRDCFPLSHAQQRLWAIEQIQPGTSPYTIFGVSRLHGRLDSIAMQRALTTLEERHASLRTSFVVADGKPQQRVHPPGRLTLEVDDLGGTSDPLSSALALAANEARRGFDLERDPLWRARLVRLGDTETLLIVHLHHIVCDGWSLAILERELGLCYQALLRGATADLPPLPIQYTDFTVWQNRMISGGDLEESRQWWLTHLAGPLPKLELPTDFSRPPVQSYAGETLTFNLPERLKEGLANLATELNVTLFDLLMALVKTLLYRYTSAEDIIVGTPSAGRVHPDLEHQVGFYVNTLALRDRIDPEGSFIELVRTVHLTNTAGLEHQSYPFDTLVDELELPRDTSRNPLFDVVIALQNVTEAAVDLGPVHSETVEMSRPVSHFDLTFFFSADAGELQVEYCTDLFQPTTVRRMVLHFETLASSALEQPDTALYALDIISTEERAAFARLNATEQPLPTASLYDLFVEQVARTPQAPALVYKEESYSYRWLQQAADNLAGGLHAEYGTLHGRSIALLCHPSPAMLTAIFAALKLGAIYVPIDPQSPAERIDFLIADSGASLLLGNREILDSTRTLLTGKDLTVVALEDCTETRTSAFQSPQCPATPKDLTYLMYTSGSTGQPKGVAIEQRSIIRLVKQTNYCQALPSDRFLQLSNYSFDGSTFDIYMSLLNGAALYIPQKQDLLSPVDLGRFIRRHAITKTFITTALFNQLVEQDPESLRSFEKIYFGGQEASLRSVRRAAEIVGYDGKLVNAYGPTETTTFATYQPVTEAHLPAGRLPIGRPISNTSVVVVDKHGQPLPPGIQGELYIGGQGLARGYHNNDQLTQEKFVIPDWGAGERYYATGDLVRFNEELELEFIGRIDTQVKLHGYRIELQEVQNSLLRLPEVAECQVVVMRDPESNAVQNLAAYFTCKSGQTAPAIGELRTKLGRWLPSYMVPHFFICLDAFPLNKNGKIDLGSLPQPAEARETAQPAVDNNPADPLEIQLATVLAEVIGIGQLGIEENFFAAGGDSIKAIIAVSRIRAVGLEAKVIDLFEKPTVRELARVVRPQQQKVKRSRPTGVVPMNPAEVWFFATQPSHPAHFNQSVLLAATAPLDQYALLKALQALVDHHDSLRARYRQQPEDLMEKRILANDQATLQIVELDDGHVEKQLWAQVEKLYSGLALYDQPLFNFVLFRSAEGDRLFMTLHHLLVDGVSWRILIEDLELAYQSALSGKTIRLPMATASVAEWSLALHDLATGGTLKTDQNFWVKEQEAVAQLKMVQPGSFADKKTLSLEFDCDFTRQLCQKANQAYGTRTDELLIAAFCKALTREEQRGRVGLTLEGHGREPLVDCDVSRTVGWLTSLWPQRIEITCHDPGDLVKEVKAQLRAVPSGGLSYGLLNCLSLENLSPPASRIGFNYLGEFGSAAEAFFSVSTEPLPAEISPAVKAWHLLDLSALVSNDRLQVHLHYDASYFSSEEASAIRSAFAEWLDKIVSHCVEQRPVTPANEFDFKGLSSEELEGLAATIAGLEG